MEGTTRLILPYADDDGNPMCYICGEYVSSGKTLYRHMSRHPDSDWRNILPLIPKNYTIMVRHTLLCPRSPDSDQSSNLTINDGQHSSRDREVVDLMNFLPEWKVTGKVKNKRGRPNLRKAAGYKNDEVLPEAVDLSVKKAKVAAADMATGGGVKRVFDLDLNYAQ